MNKEFKEYFLSLIDYQYYMIINPIGSIYFYTNEGYYLMDYNNKNNYFSLSHTYIWSKLELEFGYKHQQIKELTKGILEEHYKLKGIKIRWASYWKFHGLIKYYKLIDNTTSLNNY